ncbi:MAG: SDR family NAD(P)-dependent oxidoreductase [Thermoanaerobaculia bacterium]
MNKTALITGASSGIGWELALELSRRGWRTALLARRKEKLDALAAAIERAGGEALALECDVTEPEALKEAARTGMERWGAIDLAVANAGQGYSTAVANFDPLAARAIFRTNVEGTANLLAAVVPHMLERGRGHIVGIASLAGFRGLPGSSAYSASKAAMRSLLEAARIELGRKGILVSTINPGFIRTAMTESNRFRMPFLMDADRAARIIADAIERRKKDFSFPLPMALMMRVVRFLPNAVWDRVSMPYAKAKAKAKTTA